MAEIHDVPATAGALPDAAVGYARLTGLLGVTFAALLAVGLVLVHRSPALGASDGDYAAFYGDGGRTVLVTVVQDLGDGSVPGPDVGRSLSGVGYALVFVYAVRMAGMYAITTTTLLLHAGLLPRWVALLSYLMAAAMLVTATLHPTLLLVFPGWVALAGLIVLFRTGRSGARISPRSRP